MEELTQMETLAAGRLLENVELQKQIKELDKKLEQEQSERT